MFVESKTRSVFMSVVGTVMPWAYFSRVSNTTGPNFGLHSVISAMRPSDTYWAPCMVPSIDTMPRSLPGVFPSCLSASMMPKDMPSLCEKIQSAVGYFGTRSSARALPAATSKSALCEVRICMPGCLAISESKPILRPTAAEEPMVPSISTIFALPPVFWMSH